MNEMKPYLLWKYAEDVVLAIHRKYGLDSMEALRRFVDSETYRMLEDDSLAMWEFSSGAILDMWEAEQVTGDPRSSLYLRRDEYVE